jgi:hypothetical protein
MFFMNQSINNNSPRFGKAVMTGLFCGLVGTLACFAFEISYRYSTGFELLQLINVSSLIFSVNLLLLVVGIIYYYIKKNIKQGDILFTLFFVLLTILCIWKVEGLRRFTDRLLSVEFDHLLSGTLLIVGACAAVIPVLFNSKKFNEFIL